MFNSIVQRRIHREDVAVLVDQMDSLPPRAHSDGQRVTGRRTGGFRRGVRLRDAAAR